MTDEATSPLRQRMIEDMTIRKLTPVARQSGWEHSDNQDGHFGGRGERMIVATRR
jgi:hypothetical protein